MATKILIIVLVFNFSLKCFALNSEACLNAIRRMNWIHQGLYHTTGTSSTGDCALIDSWRIGYINNSEQKLKEEIARNLYGENLKGLSEIFNCSLGDSIGLQKNIQSQRMILLDEELDVFTNHLKSIVEKSCIQPS